MPGTHLLPPNLLKLFAPRPPLPYLRPVGKDIDRLRRTDVTGVGELLAQIKEENTQGLIDAGIQEQQEGMEEGEEPVYTLAEETRRQIRREERKKAKEEKFKSAKETYKPAEDPEAVGDPYKTLFVARLNKNATESDLRRDFETFGTIERVRIVRDKRGRSRGYAFIIYERERDMKAAFKEGDGLYILGKRILVDVERGRTVRGWKPRRLGGGLGGRPKPEPPLVSGGLRGGPRGGGRGGGGRFAGGGRGGYADRTGGGGFGGRGGPGGGFRGGPPPRGPPDFGPRNNGYAGRGAGPPGGPSGGYRGRGTGIGYQGGGFPGDMPGRGGPNGFSGGPPGGGYGPPTGYKRELGGGGGYEDRDAKRPRY